MKVVINGESYEFPDNSTLMQILDHLDIRPETVVVEMNGEILRPDEAGQSIIPPGSSLEIVHFVGGG